jgi:hypothetical protein
LGGCAIDGDVAIDEGLAGGVDLVQDGASQDAVGQPRMAAELLSTMPLVGTSNCL